MTSLEEICAALRPTIAIGAAAIPGAFTERFIELMGEFNEQPIIFALSNPTSMAECTAEQAYKLTQVCHSLALPTTSPSLTLAPPAWPDALLNRPTSLLGSVTYYH